MKNGRTLIILGALVIVAPFIGLPYSWLRFMLPVLGALVLVAGVRSRPAPRPRACSGCGTFV